MNYLQAWVLLKEFLKEQKADTEQQLEQAEQDDVLQAALKSRIDTLAAIQ